MTTINKQRNKTIGNALKLLLKLAVTGGCLWYVGQKIDWAEAFALLRQSNKGWLLAATLFFTASKVLSSIRLSAFFRCIALVLRERINLQLYWLGMFYNLFLPGGIGGDAYKGLLLHRSYPQVPGKKIAAAILLDRISGVTGLGLLAGMCWVLLFYSQWYGWSLLLLMPLGLWVYYHFCRRWFPSFMPALYPTLGMGLGVQVLQMICIACIMQSIGLQEHMLAFQLLFLLSSIVAIFPFTIGGLGAREVVFLWGAATFGLVAHQAVFISLLFYLITVVVSAVGVWYVFKAPLPAPATAPPEGKQ